MLKLFNKRCYVFFAEYWHLLSGELEQIPCYHYKNRRFNPKWQHFSLLLGQIKEFKNPNMIALYNLHPQLHINMQKLSRKQCFKRIVLCTFRTNLKTKISRNCFLDQTSNFWGDEKHNHNRPLDAYKYRQKLVKIVQWTFWPRK